MTDVTIDFGDGDADDAYDPDDDKISWDGIDELAVRYAEVELIEDEGERLEAAKRLVAELDG